jgi:hypothetical protein
MMLVVDLLQCLSNLLLFLVFLEIYHEAVLDLFKCFCCIY